MSIVGPQQRLASAFLVQFGKYGDVTGYARERGVCRQWVYREAADVRATLDDSPCRQEKRGCGSACVNWRTKWRPRNDGWPGRWSWMRTSRPNSPAWVRLWG